MERIQIIEQLNLITSDYRFIQILAIINYRDFCQTDTGLLDTNPYETLNYNEYKFLTGLWLKSYKPELEKGHYDCYKVLDETYSLMAALHNTYKGAMIDFNRNMPYAENGKHLKKHSFIAVQERLILNMLNFL